MKRTSPATGDFVNGVPELLILRLLAHRPRYGYELVKAIRLASGGDLDFGEGCIYPLLHRLEREGALVAERQDVGGRSRIVYRLTEAGQGRLAATLSLWEQTVAAVRRVLQGGEHVDPAVA